MAGPINLKLLTDFFNKIGQQQTLKDWSALPPSPSLGEFAS